MLQLSIIVNYSIYFTLHALFYKLKVGTKVRQRIIICIEISKREARKRFSKKYATKRRVNKPVAFSCLEYLITTQNKFWFGRWENVEGVTQTYTIWELEYQTSSFSATVLSINYIAKTHVENRCFKPCPSVACRVTEWTIQLRPWASVLSFNPKM